MTTATIPALTSRPVFVAMGLRMMAKHLLSTIDKHTAHPDRMAEVVADVRALIHDATALIGYDQHDRELWRGVAALETTIERLQRQSR